jgi:WD40 repeat protein
MRRLGTGQRAVCVGVGYGDRRQGGHPHRARLSGVFVWRGSPDGTRLAIASDDGSIRVLDVVHREVAAMLRVDAPLENVAWSPRGDAVAFVGDKGIYVFTYCDAIA